MKLKTVTKVVLTEEQKEILDDAVTILGEVLEEIDNWIEVNEAFNKLSNIRMDASSAEYTLQKLIREHCIVNGE